MKLYFFDTETTGLEDNARVIQFAGKRNDSDEFYCETFKPEIKINIGAMATHHITEKMVENKGKFSDRIDYLNSIFQNYVAVAHNAPFDIRIIEFEGVNKIKFFIDTKKVAQHLLQWSDNPPEQYKLQYLRYFFDIEIEATAHDAKGDVIVLEKLFYVLFDIMKKKYTKEMGVFSENEEKKIIAKMINISKNPLILRYMPFGKHKGVEFKDLPKSYISWLTKTIKKSIKNSKKPKDEQDDMMDFSEDFIYTIENLIKEKIKV